MRYELTDNLASLKEDKWSLTDEIALVRWTIQDLVRMLELQAPPQRVAVGAMLRDAIDTLSKVMERAAKMPAEEDGLSRHRVSAMLRNVEDAIRSGLTQQQLIMSINALLEGISVQEEPNMRVLRTCEMMDFSVPRIESNAIHSTTETDSSTPTDDRANSPVVKRSGAHV